MNSVITARGIGKRYQLGEHLRHNTLRDAMRAAFHRPPSGRAEDFWALKDVSFDIQQGEVIGVIGRNGAGKSTLLKVLSQITEPTEGDIRIRGRVASLLEVGTGFHPELSGRENVFLNGAILGMTRREIKASFSAIAEFAGVEKFLDTPVKRYSSGMYVRLAFAVAAHLNPEILLVDEVLAVGDASFQKKCLGKMDDVARSGRTILFVSHNMAAVESLCAKTLLLERGRVAAFGGTRDVIDQYLAGGSVSAAETDLRSHAGRPSGRDALMSSFRILDRDGGLSPQTGLDEDVVFEVQGITQKKILDAALNIQIMKPGGQRVATCYSRYQYPERIDLEGSFSFACRMSHCRLMPGMYMLTLILNGPGGPVDLIEGIPWEVVSRDIYGTGRVLPPGTGFYLPEVKWSAETYA